MDRHGRPLNELPGSLRKRMFGPMRSQMNAVTEVTRAYAEGNAWPGRVGVVDGVRLANGGARGLSPVWPDAQPDGHGERQLRGHGAARSRWL